MEEVSTHVAVSATIRNVFIVILLIIKNYIPGEYQQERYQNEITLNIRDIGAIVTKVRIKK